MGSAAQTKKVEIIYYRIRLNYSRGLTFSLADPFLLAGAQVLGCATMPSSGERVWAPSKPFNGSLGCALPAASRSLHSVGWFSLYVYWPIVFADLRAYSVFFFFFHLLTCLFCFMACPLRFEEATLLRLRERVRLSGLDTGVATSFDKSRHSPHLHRSRCVG